MAAGKVACFDLPMLLNLGDLDVRGVAAKRASLKVEEYFTKVEQFIVKAPYIVDDLAEVINLSGDEEVLSRLIASKLLLADIGYTKLSAEFDDMVEMARAQNKESASHSAKLIMNDFYALHQRTKPVFTAGQGQDTQDETDASEQTLKQFIDNLYREEETRKLRILAVDDTAFMLRTISSILSKQYEVFSLTKGTLVEKFLVHTTPELFLLDVTMPDMSGYDLVPIIRKFEQHQNTPIIFLTARSSTENVSTAVSLGARDYVIKPVVPEVLLEKVAKHIVRKKLF